MVREPPLITRETNTATDVSFLWISYSFLYSPITFRKRCFGEIVIGAGDAGKLGLSTLT